MLQPLSLWQWWDMLNCNKCTFFHSHGVRSLLARLPMNTDLQTYMPKKPQTSSGSLIKIFLFPSPMFYCPHGICSLYISSCAMQCSYQGLRVLVCKVAALCSLQPSISPGSGGREQERASWQVETRSLTLYRLFWLVSGGGGPKDTWLHIHVVCEIKTINTRST